MTQDLKTKIAEAIEASPDGPYAHEWAAQAALQAIHNAGFAVVPREPTGAQHEALTALGRAVVPDDHERDHWCWFAVKAYRVMLAASQPKTEEG